MLAKNEYKLVIDNNQIKIPSEILGVDLGYSLSKFAYSENNELIMSILDSQSGIKEIENLVNSPVKKFKNINLTGGKSFKLYNQFKSNIETGLLNEFEANARGISFLYSMQKGKALPSSIITTIGTGTSIVLINKLIEHLGGSALGGEFFMGVARLLFKINDYDEAIGLANLGNRYKVDLKVGDIYERDDKRVDLLFKEFTAASFGKIDRNFKSKAFTKEDILSSINAMLAENIGTIAILFGEKYDISSMVFCGGFLINNKVFKNIISLLCKIKNKKAIFLNYSEFAGAIGALFYRG